MIITQSAQIEALDSALGGIPFSAEFSDGLCYNDPVHGEFDKFSPEFCITIKDGDHQLHQTLLNKGVDCELVYAKKFIGNTFTHGSKIEVHVKIAEDWELHHDAAKLTGLQFELSR